MVPNARFARSREFAGRVSLSSGEVEMENLMTHYAIMNAQEECVKRPLPLPVVMYYLYLKVVHSGKTISDVLSMEDEEFGQFVGEGLQGTCSAGLFPYEQDFEPGLCLSFFHGITLTAVPTEDMVRHLHVFCVTPADTFLGFQGWALSMGQLDGRTTRDLRPIKVNANMTMSDLQALFRQDPLPRGSVRALNPETGFTPVGRCADGVLPELYRSTSTDDCESSSLNARQAKHALIKEIQDSAGITDPRARAARLRDLCKGWRMFNAFTDQSWTCMRQLVDRTGDLLLGGHLRVMTGVGMATNASLEDIKASRADFCGHCFNVGYLKTPKMEQGKAFLLEGTSAMYSLRVTKSSPRATVHLSDPETGQVVETKTLDMPAFLSALASTVLSLCSVMNKPNGGRGPDWGWPMEQEITGWLGKTAVAPTLDSAPDTPLSFYHRIMYMGWPCTTQGHGTMPVEEGGKQGVLAGCHQDEGHGAQEAGEQGILAGCHPFRLSDQSLRGVNAALPAEGVSVMAEIMEEAVPPQASVELVQKIANLWLPCRPFETINTEARREPGIRYHRVVCMESPCAPEYLAIIHEARRRLVEEANRINDARPDSDGCRLYSLLEGVEDLLCIDVKDVPMPMMTIVDSIRQAQKNIGWPKALTVKK